MVRYEAACRALAEAKAVDEVQEIRNRAEAMRIYMRQSKNKALEIDAAEIRIRAERKLGQLLDEQKRETGLNKGGRPATETGASEEPVKTGATKEPVYVPTLAEAGIDKKTSARAQKLAAVPADVFEAEVDEWRDRVEAENARVVTRLETAGERASRKKGDAAPTLESLQAENARLREDLEEARQNARELADMLEAYTACEEGIEAAAKALATEKGIRRTVEIQRDQYMVKANEAIKIIKARDRQIAAMERKYKVAA
jgi:hypothetical protein